MTGAAGMACGVALALALAGPAAAQAPDWRASAPPLPLDGEVRPLRAPVAIGGTAWGPWRRVCREQTLRPGRPMQRDCLTVAEAQAEGDAVRLSLAQEATGLRIAARRGADGRVTEFSAPRPQGSGAAADAARAGLVAAWRAQFETLSLERRRVAPGEDFPMPVEGSAATGRCRPEGTAAIGGRAVLVARCAVELAGRLRGSGATMQVAIAARLAIDTATGMVAAQGYATRMETFTEATAGGRRSNGVVVTPSRVMLE
ncbi:hypothetical protein J5Y09_17615 [Roseomonas sp. PWR1]|uniref:Uncharacterized protein n=1 Tax=Roseomonas nitratireducens TaxID=2820810 RepID=A0ABS4AWK8_9PROT|nr:hypothetical protein [Neoroseomonas nitratireducens]MBP0465750.1 hypothetical protein [Neoroseomonas nitratireducens]